MCCAFQSDSDDVSIMSYEKVKVHQDDDDVDFDEDAEEEEDDVRRCALHVLNPLSLFADGGDSCAYLRISSHAVHLVLTLFSIVVLAGKSGGPQASPGEGKNCVYHHQSFLSVLTGSMHVYLFVCFLLFAGEPPAHLDLQAVGIFRGLGGAGRAAGG